MADPICKGRRDATVHLGSCQAAHRARTQAGAHEIGRLVDFNSHLIAKMNSSLHLRNLLGLVVVAWIITFIVIYFSLGDWQTRGQFGDMFGALNVLFSGFAFAALFYTISLQQRQLKQQDEQLTLQRAELRLQREEMVASRSELARQADAQAALTRATIAQIRVASINAHIEAQKLWSDTPRRAEVAAEIEAAAEKLAELATQIEQHA